MPNDETRRILRTTIDQHVGHQPGGLDHPGRLPIFLSREIVTETNLDEFDARELHRARVALASLPAGRRERAEAWAAERAAGAPEEHEAFWIDEAIRAITEEDLGA